MLLQPPAPVRDPRSPGVDAGFKAEIFWSGLAESEHRERTAAKCAAPGCRNHRIKPPFKPVESGNGASLVAILTSESSPTTSQVGCIHSSCAPPHQRPTATVDLGSIESAGAWLARLIKMQIRRSICGWCRCAAPDAWSSRAARGLFKIGGAGAPVGGSVMRGSRQKQPLFRHVHPVAPNRKKRRKPRCPDPGQRLSCALTPPIQGSEQWTVQARPHLLTALPAPLGFAASFALRLGVGSALRWTEHQHAMFCFGTGNVGGGIVAAVRQHHHRRSHLRSDALDSGTDLARVIGRITEVRSQNQSAAPRIAGHSAL